jgi:ATP-dependent RNA helicase DDX3X
MRQKLLAQKERELSSGSQESRNPSQSDSRAGTASARRDFGWGSRSGDRWGSEEGDRDADSGRQGSRGNSSFFNRDQGYANDSRRGGKWSGDYEDAPRGGGRGGRSAASYGADGLLAANARLERELFGEHTNTGINFSKYQDIPVEATGKDTPASVTTFEELPLGPVVNNAIKLMGYNEPTPVQKYSIPIIMNHRDLMACAQTGS